MDLPHFDAVYIGSIKIDESIQKKMFNEFFKQLQNIQIAHGEPKFCIMNKIAYQQFYVYELQRGPCQAVECIHGIPIVLDWTSGELIKVKMSAYDEWARLDLEDME